MTHAINLVSSIFPIIRSTRSHFYLLWKYFLCKRNLKNIRWQEVIITGISYSASAPSLKIIYLLFDYLFWWLNDMWICSRGYSDSEFTKQKLDLKEIYDVGHTPFPGLPPDHPNNTVIDGFNQWPEDRKFRAIVEEFYSKCTNLSLRILSAIALYLGKEFQYFDNYFIDHTSFLRLNFYPALSNNGDDNIVDANVDSFGVSRHTDAGVLTVLLQVLWFYILTLIYLSQSIVWCRIALRALKFTPDPKRNMEMVFGFL